MKKNTSWKFTDESSVTFQSSVSGAGEFGLEHISMFVTILSNGLFHLGDGRVSDFILKFCSIDVRLDEFLCTSDT